MSALAVSTQLAPPSNRAFTHVTHCNNHMYEYIN